MDLACHFHSLPVYHLNNFCVFFSELYMMYVCVICIHVCLFPDNPIRMGDGHKQKVKLKSSSLN